MDCVAFRKKYNCQLLIVMLLYFSGTGNSRWVANLLGKLLDERVYALLDIWGDELLLDLEEEEALGFVFPVYAWGPPALVSGFLSKVRASKIPSYVYFVCTCGDDTGKTADIFARAVQEKGWISPAGFSVIMRMSVCRDLT
jgi:flavodoxin